MAAAAGTSPLNAGLQAGVDASGVIVANDRDRRSLAWLREQVGDAAIEAAVTRPLVATLRDQALARAAAARRRWGWTPAVITMLVPLARSIRPSVTWP